MKIVEIQELINHIAKLALEEVYIEMEGMKLHVKKPTALTQHPPINSQPTASASFSLTPIQTTTEIAEQVNTQYVTITSPMIGTFYRAPHPEAAPFVQIGDSITIGSKLCMIEAMKLFNEIEAEITGKVIQILVDDVSPVEYDQPLFIIDPC